MVKHRVEGQLPVPIWETDKRDHNKILRQAKNNLNSRKRYYKSFYEDSNNGSIEPSNESVNNTQSPAGDSSNEKKMIVIMILKLC